MDRKIFAPAERPADLRVADRDVVLTQPQHRGDLPPVFVQPLSGRLDDQRRALVVRDRRVGLQVRVLLPGGREDLPHHDVGLRQRRIDVRIVERLRDVAAADLLVQQHVGAALRMHQRRIGFQRGERIADRGQVDERDLDQLRGGARDLGALGDDERDAVALVADPLAAQHLFVGVDQPVAVVGDVGRGEDRDHAGERARLRDLEPFDAGVAAVAEDRLAVQHPGLDEVGGVARGAGHLRARVGAGDRRADQRHACTVSGSGSYASSSRTAAIIASRILR